MLPRRTEAEIENLAKSLYKNEIFTSLHLRNQDDLFSVFMVLSLGALKDYTEEDLADIGIVYEYYREAGPITVNGYPTFLSVNLLSKGDSKLVLKRYEEIKSLLGE